jgi:hypothetical protein
MSMLCRLVLVIGIVGGGLAAGWMGLHYPVVALLLFAAGNGRVKVTHPGAIWAPKTDPPQPPPLR